MKYIIINGKVVLENEVIQSNVVIENGCIIEITNSIKDGYEVIDAKGNYVAPGFIDLHTHGRASFETMNGTIEALEHMSVATLKTGTTSFLPTTMTQTISSTKKAIEMAYQYHGKEKGAKIVGIHMEGPFINFEKKGAQPGQYIIKPTIDAFYQMVGNHKDFIRLITLAPEIEGAFAFIEEMKKIGVTTSIGHSNANYKQVKEAIKHGLSHATHTFNAMTPFTHREPGTVGAVFDSDEINAELILDGYHVHFASANILIHQKGVDNVILITDSMEAAGVKEGTYQLGGQPVYVKDSQARLEDGTLAGSVLSMNEAVYNAYHKLGIPIYDAVKMASTVPAKAINQERLGSIKEGYIADLILFDEDINIKFAMVDGKIVKGIQ